MIKQFFILGRNIDLSRQEIFSYLDARHVQYYEIFFDENYLLLEVEEEIKIGELGGTIKAGLIKKSGSCEEVEAFLFDCDIAQENKFSYAVFGNCEPEVLKIKFKSEKKKAIIKHGRRRIEFQDKKKSSLPKADYYFILHMNQKTLYFGEINQEYDSKDLEFRDMNKPVRREQLAISPRLSKILINLCQAREGDLLFDPFCGIGGILIEGLLKGVDIYGIDNDKTAIYGARKNIVWIREKYKINNRHFVEKKDARSPPNKNFDAIACETPLGELFKKKPNDAKAKELVRRFESFIIPILVRLKDVKKKDAKIAIVFPRIRDFSVNHERVERETGLRIVSGPFFESRDKQFISREIVVLV